MRFNTLIHKSAPAFILTTLSNVRACIRAYVKTYVRLLVVHTYTEAWNVDLALQRSLGTKIIKVTKKGIIKRISSKSIDRWKTSLLPSAKWMKYRNDSIMISMLAKMSYVPVADNQETRPWPRWIYSLLWAFASSTRKD